MAINHELSRFRNIETVALDDGNDAVEAIDQTQLPNRLAVVALKTPQDFHDAICRLVVRGAPAIGVTAAFGIYLAAKGIAARMREEGGGAGADRHAHLDRAGGQRGGDYSKRGGDHDKKGGGDHDKKGGGDHHRNEPIDTGGSPDGLARFFSELRAAKDYLCSARPTAVNLSWALERMERAAHGAAAAAPAAPAALAAATAPRAASAASAATAAPGAASAASAATAAPGAATSLDAIAYIVASMHAECIAIRDEDAEACRRIGENGLTLLAPGMGLLTHCNAGRLATIRYGTATAPIYIGHERGYGFRVFCDETRPLLQGARLTAFELMASGVDTTLACDNMAPSLMSDGRIDAALVGSDRIAANGDAANKIGTSYVALAAKHFGIPFYVCAPSSTVDLACASGSDIRIEQRAAEEVTEMWYVRRMAPYGVKVYNPSFDVTPAGHITAIVTDRGVARPPFEKTLPALMR